MRKNFSKVAITMILVFSILFFSVNVFAFDQTPEAWAKEATINSLFYEIAYSDFVKDFDKDISREEFAMMAVNVYRIATGQELTKPTKYTFLDIETSQYKDEIQIAKNLGIVLGTNIEQTLFSPSKLVTRQEICLMIFRLLQIIDPEYNYTDIKENAFYDRAQVKDWAIKAVDFAYNEAIMKGTSTSRLEISPLANTNREQGMTLVYRMMDNWEYIAPVSQRLLDDIDLSQKSINISSKDFLEDYLRDSLLSKKRDIRITLSSELTRTDIENKLIMIAEEFKKIGYYYVPEIDSYNIEFNSPMYTIVVSYKDQIKSFPGSIAVDVDSWEDFDNWFLIQVRSGMSEASYDMLTSSMQDSTIILDRMGKLLYMHPELNYVRKYQVASLGGTPPRYTLKLEFAYSDTITLDYLSNTKDFSNSFIKANILPGMSAIEKELAIHDYIVASTEYYIETEVNQDVFYENGVFFNNIAVCQGYASAANLLLNMAGIYSIGVYGTGNDVPHAWNLVKLYGEYYHLDATWDDPVPDEPGRIRYDYFNISQSEISKTHTTSTEIDYPIANGIRHNYFAYMNVLFSTKDSVLNHIKSMIQSEVKSFSFKISNFDSETYVISAIIKQAYNELGILGYSYSYSINTEMGVIKVDL